MTPPTTWWVENVMNIVRVSNVNFSMAVAVYRKSWQDSHKDICTPEFLEHRDYAGYLAGKIENLYLICDTGVMGVFCLDGDSFGDLYIHPDHQGKGYGTECIRYALARNSQLRLTVLSTNKSAIGLYEKMGFRFTGKDIPLRNGLCEREMSITHGTEMTKNQPDRRGHNPALQSCFGDR